MSWAKFDDGFARHLKVVTLSDRAFRLHVTAILECCAQLTDGLIAERMAPHIPAAPKGKTLQATIQELVDARLWEPVDGGWLIHDWLDWNPTAADVRTKRDAARERMRRIRDGDCSDDVRANRRRTNEERKPNERGTKAERSQFVRDPTPNPDPRDPEIRNEISGSRPDRLPATGKRVAVSPAADSSQIQPIQTEPQPDSPKPDQPRGSLFRTIPEQAPPNRRLSEKQLEVVCAPLAERAQAIERNPYDASFMDPQRWPEVVEAAGVFHETWGLAKPILGNYGRDAGVKALIALYAAGVEHKVLLAAIRASRNDEWFAKQRRPGLAMLTPEVVRRLVPKPADAAWEAELEELGRRSDESKRIIAERRAEEARRV